MDCHFLFGLVGGIVSLSDFVADVTRQTMLTLFKAPDCYFWTFLPDLSFLIKHCSSVSVEL